MAVYTGSYAYIQWSPEATFNTAATNLRNHGASGARSEQFGFEQRITGWSFTQNKIPLSQLNSVKVKTFAYGQTRGSLSLDFVMSSPWFLALIGMNDAVTTGVSAPFTHTFTLDNTTDNTAIRSFSTEIGQEAGGTDIVRTLTGGVVNSATISTSVGELVKVTLDSNYANEAVTSTLDACAAGISVCAHVPYTFAHGAITSTDLALACAGQIQDFDVTFTQNADHIWGIGNSVAADKIRRLQEITGKIKVTNKTAAQLEKIYAQQKDTLGNSASVCTVDTELTNIVVEFSKDADTICSATATSQIMQITLKGVALDDINVSIEPNEPIFQELNFQAREAVIVVKDKEQYPPAQ
jgi:hypothetical protein